MKIKLTYLRDGSANRWNALGEFMAPNLKVALTIVNMIARHNQKGATYCLQWKEDKEKSFDNYKFGKYNHITDLIEWRK